MGYVFLCIALTLNAAGSILLKIGTGRLGNLEGLSLWDIGLRVATNYYIVIGLLSFGLNVVFYMTALSKLNLSIAYPIMMTGGVVIISLFSVFVLRETLTGLQVAGIVCIVLGIIFLTAHA